MMFLFSQGWFSASYISIGSNKELFGRCSLNQSMVLVYDCIIVFDSTSISVLYMCGVDF